ncbi:Na+/H+ antiporter NhaD/arsenite permease-like protein [Inhella inkyongensis]|uniref:Na+/H+ antiporter NhaD/arsenite permease-like protein n=1 Tax=Inhella inkyongensis TaxID=392593 RepID=A0A840SBR0_9BURK|nr:anion transporter [Inhella inkyongensis]MBB5205780.1 Na+/H+ antiporter NhaD/arsenite permease-like protein [Inhella inkyongensis]
MPTHPDASHWGLLTVFAVVYIGMFLGGLPRLKLDRSGIALLGAIAVLPLTGQSVQQLAQAVDLPTLVLLFAFMVLSAQLRLGGFFGELTRRVATHPMGPRALLAALIGLAAALSAVFSNDVVCLVMTPMVARLALQRGLAPVPLLIGLACAANIGSAATLIGNPQNMLIGAVLRLDFVDYIARVAVPVLLSLGLLWALLVRHLRAGKVATLAAVSHGAEEPPFDPWQSAKGLIVAGVLMLVFLFTDWPREAAALIGAAVLLMSRRLHSSEVMGFVDWPLLLLFIGLFVVNHAFETTGLAAQAVAQMQSWGWSLEHPGVLTGVTVLLSNLVSNVPAVMLLLPHLGANPAGAGALLALISTLAGNLLLVGSIANLIVVDLAAREGIVIDWRQHLRLGAPAALASLLISVLWLWLFRAA